MKMPQVRNLIVPDLGYYIADVDLDRADLQIVVWESDDADLKRQLRMGVDIHIANGMQLAGKEPPPEDELIAHHPEYPEHKRRYGYWRNFAKNFTHGTNYGGSAPTMARVVGVPIARADALQKRWFALHPGIKAWHERIETQLQTTRTVYNPFGFQRIYFDRPSNLLPEALAWIPQSTVGIIINKGMLNIYNNLAGKVELLLQVHDSLVMQWQICKDKRVRPEVQKLMLIPVPYDDPLTIPVGLKISAASWGDCKDAKWAE